MSRSRASWRILLEREMSPLLDSDMHIVDPRPACARTVTRDTTVADHDGTDGRVDPRRRRPGVKTPRNALIIIVLGLIVPAPVHAKDPWAGAFGDQPFSLKPANQCAQAVLPDY